ncbi:MAG: hypothetical protein K0R38_188 [Polyangiaceae bacterium]|jgi:hypothetical protein|nr:hypothetical protein [Polyangiaceae bacterium]
MTALSTLGAVEALIAKRRDELIIGHDFMRRLEGEAKLSSLRRLLPRLAFFTFAFQDMLKLARESCSDPVLAPIVASLEEGDRGHDRWFVEDLEGLSIELSAHSLFGAEYETGRRVAYGLISLLQSASSDHERLALLLSLEAAAREFFIRVPGFAQRAGVERELRYFGSTHLAAEEAHEVFTADAQKTLDALPVPEHSRRAVSETVEKTFALLLRLAAHLADALSDCRPPVPG